MKLVGMHEHFGIFAVNVLTCASFNCVYYNQNQALVVLQQICHYIELDFFIVITVLPLGGP